MRLNMNYLLLPCLVAMVAAAPVAEQANGNEEQVVNIASDSETVNRAKRAKEEIVFGNQQNMVNKLGTMKKSVDLSAFMERPAEPFDPLFDSQRPDNVDRSGYMFAQSQQPVQPVQPVQPAMVPEPREEGAPESDLGNVQAQPPQAGDVQSEPEQGSIQAEPQQKVEVLPPAPEVPIQPVAVGESQQPAEAIIPVVPVVEEGAQPNQEITSEKAEDSEETQPAEEAGDEAGSAQQSVLDSMQPEIQAPVAPSLPENSQQADAEEALQVQEPASESDASSAAEDDVEELLKQFKANGDKIQVAGEGQKEEGDEDEEDEESAAEAELMQMTKQNDEGGNSEPESNAYTQNLLKYILLHGDEYGRAPTVNYAYNYPSSYFLQRRRRSLARAAKRLPQLRRRHSSERGLSRAKRTKRDLFDDDLYYSDSAPQLDDRYPLMGREDEEEGLSGKADLEELISYLMALYPSIYDNQPAQRIPDAFASQFQQPQYPGYLPAAPVEAEYPPVDLDGYADYQGPWEEPEYVDMPAGALGWEPDTPALQPQEIPAAAAWEPAFYPPPEEVVEEPGYYLPAPAKRQMLSLLPGQRRKRYFYPFSREPYTHWGAFVPAQKRDYDSAYRRLKKLAMVLADSPYQSSSYFDALDEYKKKK